ncbi:hypothetical protein VPH35_001137 [Triticum aestivum]|uniref:DUF3615 domain-containing protein n=1 Tax=Triticum turgidum subsp. durum TaxID=4567 RepID=A0A9R0UTA5_TRITD|nr:uncharacterized protein LOC123098004 [Triticum aestivum]VAH02122.1 unnamed protein product [Triticum turgidum subsp. durum]
MDGLRDNSRPPFHGIDSPSPSEFRVSSNRRRRRSASPRPWPQRSADTSHAPYRRPSPSPRRERHREHHHRRERSRSPRLESARKAGSPSAKWSRFEAGSSSSSVLAPPLMDDGSTTPDCPDSPIYCYEDDQRIRFGQYGVSDGSGITDREPDGKQEDHSYNALVDDFMGAVVENWGEPANFDQAAREERYQKQTKRFAELALKCYNKNKNNKVKYSLVEAIDGAIFYERSYDYAHVNFYANAKNGPKKNNPKVLVFAELKHVGRRVNAMALTSFHFLDEKKQTTGRRDVARSSRVIWDIYHCYVCTNDIKHPEGSRYKAGHFAAVSYYFED